MAASATGEASDSIIQKAADFGPEITVFCLRHMASIAKNRDAYQLLHTVTVQCEKLNISLASVLAPCSSPDDTFESVHPAEVLEVVSQCSGYCMVKTFAPNGHASFFGNVAFERDVASIDSCVHCWERNERTVVSLILDEDGMAIAKLLTTSVWPYAVRDSKLYSATAAEHVRVQHRRLGGINCSIRMSVFAIKETGKVSEVMELVPSQGPLFSEQTFEPQEVELKARAAVCVEADDGSAPWGHSQSFTSSSSVRASSSWPLPEPMGQELFCEPALPERIRLESGSSYLECDEELAAELLAWVPPSELLHYLGP